MIKYKKNLLQALKVAGYSGYRLSHDRLIPYAVQTRLRAGHAVSLSTLDTVCTLLRCQPGELIEWVDDDTEQAEHTDSPEH